MICLDFRCQCRWGYMAETGVSDAGGGDGGGSGDGGEASCYFCQ